MDHRWLHAYGEPAPRRLFCFHHAGGGAKAFYPLAKRFEGSGVQVCGVQLPGRWGEANAVRRMTDLLPPLVESLLPELDQRAFAFYGQSLGTRVAFELMRELRRRGERLPSHFFPTSAKPPHTIRRDRLLHQASDADFVRILSTNFGGIPEAILSDERLLAVFLPPLKADIELLETTSYVEEPPLSVDVTAIMGEKDPAVNTESTERWGELFTGSFESVLLPGGHFFMKENEAAVARIVLDHWK